MIEIWILISALWTIILPFCTLDNFPEPWSFSCVHNGIIKATFYVGCSNEKLYTHTNTCTQT